MESIGSRIKAAREAAGMTQEQLGQKIGVTGVAIMRYEKGQREPTLKNIQAIADALNIHASTVMGWNPEDIGGDPKNENWMKFNRAVLDAWIATQTMDLLTLYERLNSDGQKKALERVAELTEIPRYQRQETSEQNKAAPGAANTESGKDDIDH